MLSLIPLILHIICLYFVVTYALRPKAHWATRVIFLAIAIGSFLFPWVWIALVVVGCFCWADSRVPNRLG